MKRMKTMNAAAMLRYDVGTLRLNKSMRAVTSVRWWEFKACGEANARGNAATLNGLNKSTTWFVRRRFVRRRFVRRKWNQKQKGTKEISENGPQKATRRRAPWPLTSSSSSSGARYSPRNPNAACSTDEDCAIASTPWWRRRARGVRWWWCTAQVDLDTVCLACARAAVDALVVEHAQRLTEFSRVFVRAHSRGA